MKRNEKEKKNKKKLLLLLLLLFTFGLGLGYAYLSQSLSINPSINYGSMKWNVGFTTATNGGGSVTAGAQVSTNKKSITVTCDLGTSTKSETCIVNAKIKNDSTFAIKLEADPTISFDNTYISSVATTWVTITSNTGEVKANDTIPAGEEHEVKIAITTKALTDDLLPSSSLSVPVTITMNWLQVEA